MLTFALVNIAWVFFRARSFTDAGNVLEGMFGAGGDKPMLGMYEIITTSTIVAGILAVHAYMRSRSLESVLARVPAPALSVAWGAMAFLIVAAQGTGDAFIYFQF